MIEERGKGNADDVLKTWRKKPEKEEKIMSMKETGKKVTSLLCAFALTAGAMLGSLPLTEKTVHAAGNMKMQELEKGTNITTIDPSYNPDKAQLITFKYNEEAGCKIENMNNDLQPWLDREGTKVPDAVFQNMDQTTGNPSVTYYKVAQNKATGQYYDLKMTVTGWENSKYSWVDPNGVPVPPFFAASKVKIGFYMLGLDHIDCSFQYLLDGKPMSAEEVENFHSYVTLCDLDATQAFTIKEQPGLRGVFKMAGTDNITQQEDGLIVSENKWSGGDIDDSTPAGWVTAYMAGTDRFQISFHDEQKYAASYAPGSVHKRPLLNDIYPIAYHYGFSLQTLFTIPLIEQDIVKKVGDKGVSWENASPAENKDMAYAIDGSREFDYLLLSTTNYAVGTKKYVITDTLEDCLFLEDRSKVSITDKDGNVVTDQFEIELSGQTVTCSAKDSYMKSESFQTEGQEYLVRLTVHRKQTDDLHSLVEKWLDGDGYTFHVPNKAKNFSTAASGKNYEYESNDVWVSDSAKASLKVEKDASYDGWKVGDTVEYTVKVTQTEQNGYAVGVTVTDEEMPAGLKLLDDQWEVEGPENGSGAPFSRTGENGWKVTCPLLKYGESILVKFKCLALADSNGKDSINTVRATAENFTDGNGEKRFAGDEAEVWVNSPELTVDKVANAYEYQVGDRVKYTVNVRNTKDYTVAENVVISDLSLPEGLKIAEDSGENGITVKFSPATAAEKIGWPEADGTVSLVKKERENSCSVEREGNSWTVRAAYLPSDAAMTVTFDCIAEKNVNGIETQNQVSVTADNFVDEQGQPRTAQDDAEIYVNTACFSIDKSISNGVYEWEVGDHIPFDIVVRNINDENTADSSEYPEAGAAGKTVARNVIITDKDIPAGWKLDTDSMNVEAIPEEQLPEDTGETAQDELSGEWTEDDTDVDESIFDESETPDDAETSEETETSTDADGTVTPEEPEWPAKAPSVEGIPESYEDHVAGTADVPNQLDEEQYNETVTRNIDWNLETTGNGWQLKISALPAGFDVRIHFTCEALEAGNGEENVNIGNVTAENAPESSDDSEAYVNTAVLTIDKEVVNRYAEGGSEDKEDGREPYEFRLGEDIEYRVTVRNLQAGSIARNVLISDLTLPDGLVLNDGEDAVTVSGIPQQYVNPTAGTEDTDSQLDESHYKETEVLPVNSQITREGTGWTLQIDNLPCTEMDELNQWDEPVVVTFHCTASEDVNGWEILNTAKASADNAVEVKDSERIWINSPVLNVYKNADREKYLVGDTVTYTVDMTQEQVGCVARNITVSDAIATEGVKLQKNSIVLLDKDGTRLPVPEEDVEVRGNSFVIHTGRNLIKETGYSSWDAEQGGISMKGNYNPLELESESRLTVEYAVEITDCDLAGKTIQNKVTVNSDEDIPGEAEEEVPVEGAALDVTKESDKAQYLVGETGTYKLTVRELREGVTAKAVVISDGFELEGMKIVPDSIHVVFNGEELSEVKIETQENSFLIETGMDMTITDKMEISYQVLFEDAALEDKTLRNIAVAKGSNTAEETQDNFVLVMQEKEEPTDKPEEPKPTEKPTETPEPTPVPEGKPSLEIRKSAEPLQAKPGSSVAYTLTVTNKGNAAAEQVVITDKLNNNKAVLQKDSIQAFWKEKKLTPEKMSATDSGFTMETGINLEPGEKIRLTYQVKLDGTIKSSEVKNVASASAKNAEKAEAENKISIQTEKTPEKPEPTVTPEAGKENPKDTSSSLKGNVQTGDSAPVAVIAAAGLMGILGLAGYFVLKKRRK